MEKRRRKNGAAPFPFEAERAVVDARLSSKPGVDPVAIVARENLEFVLNDLVVCDVDRKDLVSLHRYKEKRERANVQLPGGNVTSSAP